MQVVPMCGSCGEEAEWTRVQATGHCPVCVRDYFTRPVYIQTQLTEAVREIDRRLTRWELQQPEALVKDPQMEAPVQPMEAERVVAVRTTEQAPSSVIVADTAVVDPVKTEVAPASEYSVSRGHRAAATRTARGGQFEITVPPEIHDAIQRVDSWLKPKSQESEKAPWVEDWEAEYPEAPPTPGPAPIPEVSIPEGPVSGEEPQTEAEESVSSSSLVVLSEDVPNKFQRSAHYMKIHDESTFLVLPGKAAQKEFWAIFKVQRKINLEVSKRWGYYMLYAPEAVHMEVENNLDSWVRQDILSFLKLTEHSLVHPDSTTRKLANSAFDDAVPTWWQGRTVLRHYVRSISKRAPESHLSIDVSMEDGSKVEKLHPGYYTSFANTKMWFTRMI
ncbi:hypothetical protein XELAEV_18005971mg [Xenopus laevis]|uniref:Uncharacterized protein n=1 Tax=Xenopus laevis TaxID=8355 RepID=A0A974DZN9_XENLA|nr:hypothetical protein XELAEV_18005971mg [Xenopus laevis]